MKTSNLRQLLTLSLILLILSSSIKRLNAQSIDFVQDKNWNEIVAQAKLENKLIFVDVFTDWCGPCLMMEETVFPVQEVRTFYNTTFVNFRIDAEKGEGIAFRTKYAVNSYPTYLFINPETQEIVHRSSSRQAPDIFIFTGKSALSPALQSINLGKKYTSGDRDPLFLRNYAAYLASCYQTEKLNEIVDEWFSAPAVDYTSELSMEFLDKYINGADHKAFANLVENRDRFNTIYGKERVDRKLCTVYNNNLSNILLTGIYNKDRFSLGKYDSLLVVVKKQDFAGKSFLMKKAEVLDLLRRELYDEAAKIADELPAEPESNEKDILDFYRTLTGLADRAIENPLWIKHALTYSQYIAYNTEDRNNVESHFNYALLLEKAIRASANGKDIAPVSVLDGPKYGKKTYSLRSTKLKSKPKRK